MAGLGDAVVTTRRAGHRRLDLAREKSRGFQIAQHWIKRTLLAAEDALARLIELLGYLIAIHRRLGPRQHGQEHQRHNAGTQFLVELPQVRFDFDLAHDYCSFACMAG